MSQLPGIKLYSLCYIPEMLMFRCERLNIQSTYTNIANDTETSKYKPSNKNMFFRKCF